MNFKIIIIGLLVVLSFSCGHKLKEGVVTFMYIEPERDYVYLMPIPHTISTGKITSTYYSYIPVMMHDDTDYVIQITGHDQENRDLTESFYVTSTQYNCLRMGDKFKVTEDCSRETNKDIKL